MTRKAVMSRTRMLQRRWMSWQTWQLPSPFHHDQRDPLGSAPGLHLFAAVLHLPGCHLLQRMHSKSIARASTRTMLSVVLWAGEASAAPAPSPGRLNVLSTTRHLLSSIPPKLPLPTVLLSTPWLRSKTVTRVPTECRL